MRETSEHMYFKKDKIRLISDKSSGEHLSRATYKKNMLSVKKRSGAEGYMSI